MKKIYQRFVIFICIFAFCSYSFVPKKTQAFVPLVVGGVYVSYEVILATATLCAAMGIVIVNKDQLVAMAEKFNSIPDFASHVVGHSVVQIQEYWFQFLVDRVSVDGSTPLSYNYAPTEYVGTGISSPYVSLNQYLVDLKANNTTAANNDYNTFQSLYSDSAFNTSAADVFSSVQSSGLPYVIYKYEFSENYRTVHAKDIFVSLDNSPLTMATRKNITLPVFRDGRILRMRAYYITNSDGSIYSSFNSFIDSNNTYSSTDTVAFYAISFYIQDSGTTLTENVWDYGNCTLPSSDVQVGDYGQVTSPALPTDQAKHWGDVFGADQSGTIDMGKALDDLKAKGIDTSKAATVDGVNAMDISYPLDSVQDISDVDVGDISQDSSVPYVPDFDTPDFSSSAQLDFKPLMIVTKKFPFSLPWDLALAINSLSSDSVVPSYEFPSIPVDYKGNTIATIPGFTFTLSDLPFNDTLINILRTFEIISFCVFLIIKTRDLIRS